MFHPLINLLLVLLLIVFLMRKRLELGLVMLSAGVLLGILSKIDGAGFLRTFKAAVFSDVFLQLGIALNIIMFLEHILRTKGYLNRIVTALRHLIPNSKINIMLLPAFLGLLPSPGGALFSAPLVAEAGSDLEMSLETKSLVNYWFRHLWEYFIPLYPGIILGSKILAVPLNEISLYLAGFFVLAVIIGYSFYIKPIKVAVVDTTVKFEKMAKRKAWRDLFLGIWPIFVIVFLVLFFSTDVGLTVSCVLLALLFINKYNLSELKVLWRESFKINLILLIVGILFFKEMMITSGVVGWLPKYLHGLGVPDLLVVALLTFLVALAVGLSQGYIAATFPLLTGIIGTGSSLSPGLMILAYISGFVGIMLSPTHLCFVLTIDYFRADFNKVWQRLVLPETLMLAAAFLCALFWK